MTISEQQIFLEFSKLKLDSEYEKSVYPMNEDDNKTFDKSIKENGIREPLTINRKNIVLDGHLRYKKAEKYKIELIPIKVKHFEDLLEEEKYVIECNLQRRQLNTYQKIELGIKLLAIEKQIAKKRQKEEGAKYGRGKKKTLASSEAKDIESPLASKEANGKKGKSAKIVAKKVGTSLSTMEKGIVIEKKASKEMKEKLRKGTITVNSAYQQVTKKTRSLPTVPLPKGEFDIVLCDVPIGFKDQGGRGAAENHYPTMTAQELSKLKIPTSKNAIIFFWMSPSIQYSIVESSEVDRYPTYQYILDHWDFTTVKGEFVWDKEIIGLGSWNRNQHENCLIAIKGKFPCPAELFSSIISERRTKHSKKPELIYSIIEKMFPERNYLELFGRVKRKGWTVFGNEVKEIQEPKLITICTICWSYHNGKKTKNKYTDFNSKEKQKQHLIKEHGNLDELPYPMEQYFDKKTLEQIEENQKLLKTSIKKSSHTPDDEPNWVVFPDCDKCNPNLKIVYLKPRGDKS